MDIFMGIFKVDIELIDEVGKICGRFLMYFWYFIGKLCVESFLL